jgi:hypothetical protein
MTPKGRDNMKYVARIIAERETGNQDNYERFMDEAVNMVLLIEQLGFLNKKRFWGEKNNESD